MSQIIDLYDFLSNKIIIHSEDVTNHKDGLILFIENKEHADAITYNSVRHFSINNISMLELDEKGNFFYEFSVDRNGDIIDNIILGHLSNINAQLTYYISGKRFLPNEVKKFVFCCAMYNDLKIRVTFLEKPNANDEFRIIMRNYLLDPIDRKSLATNPLGVECDNIRYYNGVCCGL
jgi:hypothetical protein